MSKARKEKGVDALAPKPVHPKSVKAHGLFGIPYVRQHMVFDKRWSPSSLSEEFKGMTDLLAKRFTAEKLENIADHKNAVQEFHKLRDQCNNGRYKLQMSLHGSNTLNIRNFLINHKDLQRLYQRMPIQLVVENINQRTFVMRKERDRLRYRLNLLKTKYHDDLVERATLENRIKYENEFVLEEEIKARELRKRIEAANVRLRASKTINGTYKKMIQVLRHDSIFHEPILRSLDADIEDQAHFIKHILYLGMPGIAELKDLKEEYRLMEDRTRKEMHSKVQLLQSFKKSDKRLSQLPQKQEEELVDLMKRYVRETDSMMKLKLELEGIEETIKRIKITALVSQAKEIFPRIKTQLDNNEKLQKGIGQDVLGHEIIETKMKRAQVLEDVLINNLSDEEKKRLEHIQHLENSIREENEKEDKTIAYIKNRADAFVLLRFSLWNLNDILRHVDRPSRVTRIPYQESYLKLPLLKFEMLTMRAVPPDDYESDIDELLRTVSKKVSKLMVGFKSIESSSDLKKCNKEYSRAFEETVDFEEEPEEIIAPSEVDEVQEAKTMQGIPNRKQIKTQSTKLCEELRKEED